MLYEEWRNEGDKYLKKQWNKDERKVLSIRR